MTNPPAAKADSQYREHVRQRIETLLSILAQASVGNFSHNVPLTGPHDEFSELYVGVQIMLEVIREKLDEQKHLNAELERHVAQRTQDLQTSETRFRSVAETANDAIVTTDSRGRIVSFNRAAETIFGHSAKGVLGRPLSQLVPTLAKVDLTQMGRPNPGKRQLSRLFQATAKYKSDRKFPVELSFATWESGGQTFVTAIARDLTVHQLLLGRLSQQTEQLKNKVAEQTKLLRRQLAAAEQTRAEDEALLSSLGQGVVGVTKSGKIFYANREFARMADTTIDQLKGRPYHPVLTIEDTAGHTVLRTQRPMYRALTTGRRVSSSDYRYRTATGERFPVAITAAPIVLKGRTIGGIDVIRDITKEKAADELKSEFVSLASHQLRTPATAVKGLLSLLLDGYTGPLAEPQTEKLQLAYTENEHELRLIDDMLDVAKLDAGEFVLERSKVNLAELINAVVAEVQSLVQARRQDLTVKVPNDLVLSADREKLHMVFENLITNAAKYTAEHGHIDIAAHASANQVFISILDNGIGMATGDLANLFKRFSRLANAAKTHTSGSGLGLYLAKKIVDLHGGHIQVESNLGQGSTFTVVLPYNHERSPQSNG